MNTAARAQWAGEAGGILITRAVYDRAGRDVVEGEGREYQLKGFEAPVQLYSGLTDGPHSQPAPGEISVLMSALGGPTNGWRVTATRAVLLRRLLSNFYP